MDINRIAAKLFVAGGAGLDTDRLIPVFHGWIQRQAVTGLLIDVADYGHVIDGPGVLLIGDEADRALDLGDGRPGFAYFRKRRAQGTPRERIAASIAEAVIGADLLEREPALDGLRFSLDEFEVRIADRLHAPNTSETFASLAQDVIDAIGDVLGDVEVELTQAPDERRPFTVTARISGAGALADLADLAARATPAPV